MPPGTWDAASLRAVLASAPGLVGAVDSKGRSLLHRACAARPGAGGSTGPMGPRRSPRFSKPAPIWSRWRRWTKTRATFAPRRSGMRSRAARTRARAVPAGARRGREHVIMGRGMAPRRRDVPRTPEGQAEAQSPGARRNADLLRGAAQAAEDAGCADRSPRRPDDRGFAGPRRGRYRESAPPPVEVIERLDALGRRTTFDRQKPMKAWRLEKLGDRLSLEDIPVPEPRPGSVLARVEA